MRRRLEAIIETLERIKSLFVPGPRPASLDYHHQRHATTPFSTEAQNNALIGSCGQREGAGQSSRQGGRMPKVEEHKINAKAH
jgi:hypothetical protein